MPTAEGGRGGHGGDVLPAGHLLQRDHGLGPVLPLLLLLLQPALGELRQCLELAQLSAHPSRQSIRDVWVLSSNCFSCKCLFKNDETILFSQIFFKK